MLQKPVTDMFSKISCLFFVLVFVCVSVNNYMNTRSLIKGYDERIAGMQAVHTHYANVTHDLYISYANLRSERDALARAFETYKKDVEATSTLNVTVTFYHPDSRGINSDSDPSKTALMVKPIVGKTIAISKELFDLGWLGKKIYIEGFGIRIASDRMNSNVQGKHIDICVASKEEAFKLGIKYGIKAVKIGG